MGSPIPADSQAPVDMPTLSTRLTGKAPSASMYRMIQGMEIEVGMRGTEVMIEEERMIDIKIVEEEEEKVVIEEGADLAEDKSVIETETEVEIEAEVEIKTMKMINRTVEAKLQ